MEGFSKALIDWYKMLSNIVNSSTSHKKLGERLDIFFEKSGLEWRLHDPTGKKPKSYVNLREVKLLLTDEDQESAVIVIEKSSGGKA